MKGKNDRLAVLRMILSNCEVSSQENLIRELEREGHKVTQATLSRDLRELNAAKMMGPNGYIYVLPDHPHYKRTVKPSTYSEYRNTAGYIGMEFSGNLAVIRTKPGHAGVISSEIDNCNLEAVCGTVAGDDTIIVVIREGYSKEDVITQLSRCVPCNRM